MEKFHANETKNTCCINAKIVQKSFCCQRGLSTPAITSIKTKTSFQSSGLHRFSFGNTVKQSVIKQQNTILLDYACSGMLLTVKDKAKTRGLLISRLLKLSVPATTVCC